MKYVAIQLPKFMLQQVMKYMHKFLCHTTLTPRDVRLSLCNEKNFKCIALLCDVFFLNECIFNVIIIYFIFSFKIYRYIHYIN